MKGITCENEPKFCLTNFLKEWIGMEVRKIGDNFRVEGKNFKLPERARNKLLKQAGDLSEDVSKLLDEAEAVAFPKALFSAMLIDEKGEDSVTIHGVTFKSSLLRKNFENVNRVFAYIVTCGEELETWSKKYEGDFLLEYWTNDIKETFLYEFAEGFYAYLKNDMGIGKNFGRMNPGSLSEWPLSCQQDLFALFGPNTVRDEIGVTLTPSMLMLPSKSVSGFVFSGDGKFENCQFCPIRNCPNRRAPSMVM
jgi:hypothetical protein